MFKKGDKVKLACSRTSEGPIITNTSLVCVVAQINSNGQHMRLQDHAGWTLMSEWKLLPMTKAELEEEIKTKEQELDYLQSQLTFVVETGQEQFDETEFKAWKVIKTLKLIGSEITELDAAKAIAQIINA